MVYTRQVCGVGGDHDEGEEPPHAGHHPGRDRPGGDVVEQGLEL